MHLTELKLYHFRNLSDQTIHLGPGVTCVIGQNGHGKTNLIEAVNLLSHTKSFRTNKRAELVRWGEKDCSVFAKVVRREDEISLGYSIERGVLSAYVNQEKLRSVGEFIGNLRCITFSPTDLQLVKGPPGGRRRFLDKHAVDLDHGFVDELLSYQRALRNKSALLKSQQSAEISDQVDSWNEILIEKTEKITTVRRAFVEELERRAAVLYAEFGAEKLSCRLESAFLSEGKVLGREQIAARFAKVKEKEILFRRAEIGPHRDDLAIFLDGKDTRAYASQGQTRSIVLSLKLAVIELLEERFGDSPLVLLDDVDWELDASRRHALFELALRGNRQVLITGTEVDREVQKKHAVEVIEVRGGEVFGASEAAHQGESKLAFNH